MREAFIEKEFRASSAALIGTMNAIIGEYSAKGYALTLRQLYYQLVARNVIPNNDKSYDRTGRLLSDARLCGLADWDAIEDRGRVTRSNRHELSPAGSIRAAARSFMLDRWRGQEWHVELMIEKQALEGLISKVCGQLDIRYTANKGYSSSSALYRTGKRLRRNMDAGKKTVVLYLGDHDPSGMDMSRDIADRLGLLSGKLLHEKDEDRLIDNPALYDAVFKVERIALNMDQITRFNPPPNPTKPLDTRSPDYVAKFGYVCWELDALSPETLNELITEKVKEYRDEALYLTEFERELRLQLIIQQLADQSEACETNRDGGGMPQLWKAEPVEGFTVPEGMADLWFCSGDDDAAFVAQGHVDRHAFAEYCEGYVDVDYTFNPSSVSHVFGFWEVRGLEDPVTRFVSCVPSDSRAKPFTVLEVD